MGVRWSRMSWADKNELWQRWRRGETLDQIARALHRGSSSIYDYVGAEGGVAPRPRRRSRLCTDNDRAGGDFAASRARPILARRQPDARAGAIDDQPRSREESGPYSVSCCDGRSTGVATHSPSHAVPAGHASCPAPCRCGEARCAVVTATNLRLASRCLSGRC